MACIGGKGDPNLYILLEFLVVRDGFLYLFLFNTKTIKIGAVEFGWLLLTMPGEQICIVTAWANPGAACAPSQRKLRSQFSQLPLGPHRGSTDTQSSARRG